MNIPSFDDVLQAHQRIAPYVHRTPVLTSSQLNRLTGAELYFKCENLQKVGAFKARGACNAVMSLSDRDAARGVAAHSSGNHAAALCYAAAQRGIQSRGGRLRR
jgi:threonine dehydratase